MDDERFNMRNWGYYEPSLKGQLNLQLMSNAVERGTKSFLPGRDPTVMVSANGAYHHQHQFPHPNPLRDFMVSEASSHNQNHTHMDYTRGSWVNQKFLSVFPPPNHNYNPPMPETSQAHGLHMLHPTPPSFLKDERVDKIEEEEIQNEDDNNNTISKKRKNNETPKNPKTKKPRKNLISKENGSTSVHRAKTVKNVDVVINGKDMDISSFPIPICSCTGTPQQCYRWGCGGWQSACCTTNMSVYPLPMSTKRRGARIAGRKMSQGAFKKVLEKLAGEGYDFTEPIDLMTHWAKHGTNKFVTIR